MQQEKHWKTELVFFRSIWHEVIVAVDSSDPNFRQEWVNLGHNKSTGVEWLSALSLENWSVDFSASFVESENEHTHYKFVAFPKWIFNLGVGYKMANNISIYMQKAYGKEGIC